MEVTAPARPPVRGAWLRRGLLAGGAAAVAAAAALALVGRERAPDEASRAVTVGDASVSLVLVSGAVEVRGVQASAGAALGTNDAVRIGDGRACLAYSTGISAGADVGSRLVLLDAEAGHRRLRLDAGAVVCQLEPQPSGTRFSVDTAAGRITARGTVFAVEHLDGAEVAVRLRRGVVVVEAVDGSRAELSAPASAVLGAGIRPAPPTGAGWEHDARLSALAELWAEGATAPLDIDTRPPNARIALDGLDLETHDSSVIESGSRYYLYRTGEGLP
ncbi:MAG: FecR domain-containing protein [Polyangiaceae bacterium]|nr:FecR domain-containing protein [Polyangiaceae bacterium]